MLRTIGFCTRHYGKVLIDAGDMQRAAEHLHSALEKYPWDSSLYLNLGNIETEGPQ